MTGFRVNLFSEISERPLRTSGWAQAARWAFGYVQVRQGKYQVMRPGAAHRTHPIVQQRRQAPQEKDPEILLRMFGQPHLHAVDRCMHSLKTRELPKGPLSPARSRGVQRDSLGPVAESAEAQVAGNSESKSPSHIWSPGNFLPCRGSSSNRPNLKGVPGVGDNYDGTYT